MHSVAMARVMFGEFEKPKILYPQIARTYRFAFDEENYFCNDKAFFIPTDNLYLLAILQSRVAEFYLRILTATEFGGFMNLHKQFIEKVPIPDVPISEQQIIKKLVQELLELKGEGAGAKDLEQELNERVYWLFNLTRDEINLIEERIGSAQNVSGGLRSGVWPSPSRPSARSVGGVC